jgi:hypothetical protein
VNHFKEDEEQIPSFPISLKEMYQCLLNIGQIAPIPALAMQPPFPYRYKLKLKCEYLVDALGHNIETCLTFKRKVLQVIKVGWITFDDAPNVNLNPLPNNASKNRSVNAIKTGKKRAKTMKITMNDLYQVLNTTLKTPS